MREVSKVPVTAGNEDMSFSRHRHESQDYLWVSQLSYLTLRVGVVGVQNLVSTTIRLRPHVNFANNRRGYRRDDPTAGAVRYLAIVVSW